MRGSKGSGSSEGNETTDSVLRPSLVDLERVLSGRATPEVEAAVSRCLRESHSPLAQLVDLLGSHELVPAHLFAEVPSSSEDLAASAEFHSLANPQPVRTRSWSWLRWVSRRWTTAGLCAAVVVVVLTFVAFWRPSSLALAAVERQLLASDSQLDLAFMLVDEEDYSEAEMASIQLRVSLDAIRAITREHLARRRRMAISAWALESISLGQRSSFKAAEASLEQAGKLLLDDPSDRLSAAALAYARGKLEFQKSQRRDIESMTRLRHLIMSERYLVEALELVMGQQAPATELRAPMSDSSLIRQREHSRERLESLTLRSPMDERLAIRTVITLATTIHKSATPSSGSRDRNLALSLYAKADALLQRYATDEADLTWDLLRVQLAERRGLSLVSRERFAEALVGYEAAIRRLENRTDTDPLKLDYPLGILNSNRADVLAAIGDRPKEIEARSAALRHLERFALARPTTNGFVNVRLNRARRALARFAQGESFAAIDDMVAFFAITPAFADDQPLAQLTPFESARLYLIKAWHNARIKSPFEDDVKWAADRLAVDKRLDGLDDAERRAAFAPYLRLAELEPSPAYRDLRERWSTMGISSDGADAATSVDAE